MSVDFSDWSAVQTPVVTILVLAAIGVVAGVVCRLVLRRLYPFGYGQIGEPVASILVGMLAFLVAFAVCMSLGMTPVDVRRISTARWPNPTASKAWTAGTAPVGPPCPMEPNTASPSARVERA